MKDKIIYLIIGILIGAIVTAGGFLVFGKNNQMQGRPDRMQMDENTLQEGGFKGSSNRTPLDGDMVPPENKDQNQTTNTEAIENTNNT